MFDYLENLRSKPRATKKRIAFLTSFTFTGIILIFWSLAVYPSFIEQTNKEKSVKKNETSPIASVGAIFSDNFSKIKDQLSLVREVGENFAKEAAYYSSSTTATTTSTTVNDNANVQNTANVYSGTEGDLP